MTTYRSLLVHLDDRERCSARVEYAVRLAARLDAHLVGLAPTGVLDLPLEVGPGLLGIDTTTTLLAALRRTAGERAVRFREQCGALGAKSFEAVVDDGESVASIVTHGRCSDLVILGQAEPSSTGAVTARAQALVERVVLQNARPTLLVPYAGRFDSLGDNVLVAWNDSKESARAVGDALPLLQKAQQVHLMHCDTPAAAGDAGMRARLEALHRWLLWHGVEASLHVEPTQIDVGDTLMSRAADLGADLLVMGAYGHSRWAERVMGGATREVLRQMTLPVLMSH